MSPSPPSPPPLPPRSTVIDSIADIFRQTVSERFGRPSTTEAEYRAAVVIVADEEMRRLEASIRAAEVINEEEVDIDVETEEDMRSLEASIRAAEVMDRDEVDIDVDTVDASEVEIATEPLIFEEEMVTEWLDDVQEVDAGGTIGLNDTDMMVVYSLADEEEEEIDVETVDVIEIEEESSNDEENEDSVGYIERGLNFTVAEETEVYNVEAATNPGCTFEEEEEREEVAHQIDALSLCEDKEEDAESGDQLNALVVSQVEESNLENTVENIVTELTNDEDNVREVRIEDKEKAAEGTDQLDALVVLVSQVEGEENLQNTKENMATELTNDEEMEDAPEVREVCANEMEGLPMAEQKGVETLEAVTNEGYVVESPDNNEEENAEGADQMHALVVVAEEKMHSNMLWCNEEIDSSSDELEGLPVFEEKSPKEMLKMSDVDIAFKRGCIIGEDSKTELPVNKDEEDTRSADQMTAEEKEYWTNLWSIEERMAAESSNDEEIEGARQANEAEVFLMAHEKVTEVDFVVERRELSDAKKATNQGLIHGKENTTDSPANVEEENAETVDETERSKIKFVGETLEKEAESSDGDTEPFINFEMVEVSDDRIGTPIDSIEEDMATHSENNEDALGSIEDETASMLTTEEKVGVINVIETVKLIDISTLTNVDCLEEDLRSESVCDEEADATTAEYITAEEDHNEDCDSNSSDGAVKMETMEIPQSQMEADKDTEMASECYYDTLEMSDGVVIEVIVSDEESITEEKYSMPAKPEPVVESEAESSLLVVGPPPRIRRRNQRRKAAPTRRKRLANASGVAVRPRRRRSLAQQPPRRRKAAAVCCPAAGCGVRLTDNGLLSRHWNVCVISEELLPELQPAPARRRYNFDEPLVRRFWSLDAAARQVNHRLSAAGRRERAWRTGVLQMHVLLQEALGGLKSDCSVDDPETEQPAAVRLAMAADGQFRCAMVWCEFRSEDQRETMQHESLLHGRHMWYTCDECQDRFTSKLNMERHSLGHQGGPWSCRQCGEWFSAKVYLCEHTRMHRDVCAQFQCTTCRCDFLDMESLRQHTIMAHSQLVVNVPGCSG